MPSHSKAIRQDEIQHAVSEAIGLLAITAYVAVLASVVTRVAMLAGILA